MLPLMGQSTCGSVPQMGPNNTPFPSVKHALGSGSLYSASYLCYTALITWLGELHWGFDGQAHHAGGHERTVSQDKTQVGLLIGPRG